MSERDVRIKATTEGTDKAARDFEKIAGAEKKVTEAASETAEKTREQESAFRRALRAAKDFAHALLDVADKAADLTKKLIDINGLVRRGTRLVRSLTRAMVAFVSTGSLATILNTWRKINKEMREAVETQRRFGEESREIADREAGFDQFKREALLSGKIGPQRLAGDRGSAARKEFDRLRGFGVPDQQAFGISAGLEPPLTRTVEKALGAEQEKEKRGRPARFGSGAQTTGDLEKIAQLMQVTVERVIELQEETRKAQEAELLDDQRRQQVGGTAVSTITRVFKQELIDPLLAAMNQLLHSATGARVGFGGGFRSVDQVELDLFRSITRQRTEKTLGEGPQETVNQTGASLQRAADALKRSAESMDRATDRQEREKASRHVEPQAMDAIS